MTLNQPICNKTCNKTLLYRYVSSFISRLSDMDPHWISDEQLNNHYDNFMRGLQGGSDLPPLYHVLVDPLIHRRSYRMGVDEEIARVRLTNNPDVREDSRYLLIEQLTLAIEAVRQLLNHYPDLKNRDRLYFTLGSNLLDHAFDGWGVTVEEWRNQNNPAEWRVARLLANLARLLNSNEQFTMDDSFCLSLVVVRNAPRGGGKTSTPKHKRKHLRGKLQLLNLRWIKNLSSLFWITLAIPAIVCAVPKRY